MDCLVSRSKRIILCIIPQTGVFRFLACGKIHLICYERIFFFNSSNICLKLRGQTGALCLFNKGSKYHKLEELYKNRSIWNAPLFKFS